MKDNINAYKSQSLNRLYGYRFDFGYNKEVSNNTKVVFDEIGLYSLEKIMQAIMPSGKVAIVTDNRVNMDMVTSCEDILTRSGYNVLTHIFENDYTMDENIASQLDYYPEDVRVVVAIGGESVFSIANQFCHKRNIKRINVVSSVCERGFFDSVTKYKRNGLIDYYEGLPPLVVIFDLQFLCGTSMTKPQVLALLSSVFSHYLNVYDSYFYERMTDDNYTPFIRDFTVDLLDMLVDRFSSIRLSEKDFVLTLIDSNIRLELINSLVKYKKFYSLDSVCNMLSVFSKKIDLMGLPQSAIRFYMAKKLAKIYLLSTDNEIRDLGFPPDNGERAEVATTYFNIDRFAHFRHLNKISYDDLENKISQKFIECKDDLLEMATDIVKKINKVTKLFGDNKMLDVLSSRDIKMSLALAPDFYNQTTNLTILKEYGLLESYLDY